MPRQLYAEHLSERQRLTEAALAATGWDGLVLHSGRLRCYYADDQTMPFRPAAHFAHWLPLREPDNLLLVRPGSRALLIRCVRQDYWYEQAALGAPFWLEHFDVVEVADVAQAFSRLPPRDRLAFVGEARDLARAHGFGADAVSPAPLAARLDWDRGYKTGYEVACIENATARAARAHRAARRAFEEGASELGIHHAYVRSLGCTDQELPYESIVALDEKAAYLHYLGKRRDVTGQVLLIDSGATHLGYACDITRTWTLEDVEPRFRELTEGLNEVQRRLCEEVRPGRRFVELQQTSEMWIAELLRDTGIVKLPPEDAVATGLVRAFYPHGVGHHLGLQVHDVGGRQAGPGGGEEPAPEHYPSLRTTRTVEPRQVFTVEPGVYFIDMLLAPQRTAGAAAGVDWSLVERLAPLGGVRIEDNVLVTADGHRNLTRPALPEP